MKITMIDYTGHGHEDPARHAANVLCFTKQTRLEMSPGLMETVASWPEEKIMAELAYMANTIPSSWEMISYTFLVSDVTRAFTHQFVRTRTGSYAQQTLRVLNVGGWSYGTGPSIEEDHDLSVLYEDTMSRIAEAYNMLIEMGAKIEDARGVLPTNIETNIVAKFDLRTLADTMRKRASGRTQGEYRHVMEALKAAVIDVHPWAELFFNRTFDVAAAELEDKVRQMAKAYGHGEEETTQMVKLIDQMRMTA